MVRRRRYQRRVAGGRRRRACGRLGRQGEQVLPHALINLLQPWGDQRTSLPHLVRRVARAAVSTVLPDPLHLKFRHPPGPATILSIHSPPTTGEGSTRPLGVHAGPPTALNRTRVAAVLPPGSSPASPPPAQLPETAAMGPRAGPRTMPKTAYLPLTTAPPPRPSLPRRPRHHDEDDLRSHRAAPGRGRPGRIVSVCGQLSGNATSCRRCLPCLADSCGLLVRCRCG